MIYSKALLQGGREYQQDYIGEYISDDLSIFALADGMGGYEAGEIASKIAVGSVLEQLKSSSFSEPKNEIKNAILKANSDILNYLEKHNEIQTMMTTIIVLVIKNNKAYISHIGDSRLYYFENNKLIFKTRDHSLVQHLVDIGEIQYNDLRTHPDRNKVLYALGSNDTIKISFQSIDIKSNSLFVLCSDGLWEPIGSKEIIKTLNNKIDENSAMLLAKKADKLGNGRHDNISIIIVG